MIPWSKGAELLMIVQAMIAADESEFQIPPPRPAELPLTVLLVTHSVELLPPWIGALWRAPPAPPEGPKDVEFPLNVHPTTTLDALKFSMPPPHPTAGLLLRVLAITVSA